MIKAVAGGGGKGMRLVANADELGGALRAARSEALSAFGDGAVYFERRISRPRHIEIQLLGDEHGTVVPFVERECSVQRRHQKVLEESPSIAVDLALRGAMAQAAARIARAVWYTNAGTIEFLLDDEGKFYFLEMNTRLQVEHPITEAVTGTDLVQWQFRLAEGARLDIDPEAALRPRGHAIEARIYAEDPDQGFLPSPGRIAHLRVPAGPGVREDGGYEPNAEVPIFYDSLISKLIAWGARPAGSDRAAAAGAHRVRDRGNPDDDPVLPMVAGGARLRDREHRHDVARSRAGQPQRHAVQWCPTPTPKTPPPLPRRSTPSSEATPTAHRAPLRPPARGHEAPAAKPFADACAFRSRSADAYARSASSRRARPSPWWSTDRR